MMSEQPSAGAEPIKALLPSIQSPADLKKLDVADLPQLAHEVRAAICDQVSRTGGHLAPNLGVVELTIALHYVFDFSHDRLLWDVGHQCYTHKLLTGRQDLFPKLKQQGGMAGFPEPLESEYDLFSVGHAGTAISTGVGMARGDADNGQADRRSVALVGDASIVNGLAMEGLNDLGTLKRQFLVVLNDNGMAIAKPQGALAQYLDRVRVSHTYEEFRKRAREMLKRLPGGAVLEEVYHRLGEISKAAISHEHMFQHFGLLCIGPIDGHDLPSLIEMLNEVKDLDHPVLLHCKTVKGKGFEFSEQDSFRFHSPKPFVVQDCRVEMKSGSRSFTAAYSDAMTDLMQRDEKVVAFTAAMPDGTGLDKVAVQFPTRTHDLGLCESHVMDVAAGYAKTGWKPFFAVYSTFSQRALDQVFQEIALQGLPVRVCMDRAGYVGGDGAIMHGFMDIAMYSVFPNAVLLAAGDEQNLRAGLEFMSTYEAGPTFIRYPRDKVAAQPLVDKPPPFELGKALLMQRAKSRRPDLAVLAYGSMVYHAADAMRELETQGYDIALYDARFAKPVDIELLRELVQTGVRILTIEDHGLSGGFGANVLTACHDHGLSAERIHRLAMPDRWIYHDSRAGQLEQAGLDVKGIARKIREVVDQSAATVEPTVQVKTPSPLTSRSN